MNLALKDIRHGLFRFILTCFGLGLLMTVVLSMIGISICGTMASGMLPLKGWITGWLGMLIAFVGYDAIHGVARFTYEIPALYDGINYVGILIGMYGLTEVLKSLPEREGAVIPEKVGRTTPSLGILARHMPAAARSGLISSRSSVAASSSPARANTCSDRATTDTVPQ